MRTPRCRALVAVGALVLGVLSGCTTRGAVDEPVRVDSFLGSGIRAVVEGTPDDLTLLSYDLTEPVTSRPSDESLAGSDSWVVVVACGTSETLTEGMTLAVGLVSLDAYTEKIAERARAHFYDQYLEECDVAAR